MDYSYIHSPNPTTQPAHQFLTNLSQSPPDATEKTVTEIAKKCFNLNAFQTLFFDAREKILNSVEVLVREAAEMPSFSDAQREIDGAIQGLNLLRKNETDESKKIDLQETLKTVGRYGQTIKDIFFVKEAIKEKPELRRVIHEPDFIQNFRNLTVIYGRTRAIDSPLIQAFIVAWMKPDVQPLLKAFLKEGNIAKTINIEMLRQEEFLKQGRLPLPGDDHNKKLTNTYADLMGEANGQLNKADMANFKILMDEILDKFMVTNAQIHTDGLYSAFNSEAKDTFTQRLRETIKQGEESYQQTMKQLKEAASSSSVDQQKIQTEISNREKLKGYYPRVGGIYQKAAWDPMIGPEDPIRPLTRTIGFATKEGTIKDSKTPLDFTKALGQENLVLSMHERKMLSDLLSASDVAVQKQNAFALKEWNESHTIPPNVQQVLAQFDDDQLPHLKSLSPAQREMLVNEALRFAFEVNHQLKQDLLTL